MSKVKTLESMRFILKMDRPINKESHYIMPGGYSVNGKGFDFFTSYCNVSVKDPTLLECEVEGFQCIPEDEDFKVTKRDMKKGFDEFFVYCGEKGEDAEIIPLEVRDLNFVFANEDGIAESVSYGDAERSANKNLAF